MVGGAAGAIRKFSPGGYSKPQVFQFPVSQQAESQRRWKKFSRPQAGRPWPRLHVGRATSFTTGRFPGASDDPFAPAGCLDPPRELSFPGLHHQRFPWNHCYRLFNPTGHEGIKECVSVPSGDPTMQLKKGTMLGTARPQTRPGGSRPSASYPFALIICSACFREVSVSLAPLSMRATSSVRSSPITARMLVRVLPPHAFFSMT